MEASRLKDPLYEQTIGRISGARAPDNPDETWCAKVTRAQDRPLG